MSYRVKIYIQYHYVYYIYTLCLYLIYLHLIYSHLIYSHLIYSHLIYLPFKFTSIIFQKIRRCAPHIETYQTPPPSLSAQPFVPSTVAYRHKSTKLPSSTTKNSLKKPEGCAEGPRLCGPFAVFLFSSKKILCVIRQKSKRHTVFKKKYF